MGNVGRRASKKRKMQLPSGKPMTASPSHPEARKPTKVTPTRRPTKRTKTETTKSRKWQQSHSISLVTDTSACHKTQAGSKLVGRIIYHLKTNVQTYSFRLRK